MTRRIGIDLGTTNSCVSYMEGSEAMIVPMPEGSRIVPTVIALAKDGNRIYGNIAKRQLVTNPENTYWALKRLIGRKFDSPEVLEMSRRASFPITSSANGDAAVRFAGKVASPEEVVSGFLAYLKEVSENYLGTEIQDAVITVPAFYDDAQRQATKVAGEIAGLNVIRIINEPTAALLAYRRQMKKDGLYAVYDLGGGTFDISLVEVQGDVFQVLATAGDTFLGGGDFDARICEWILHQIELETAVDLRGIGMVQQRLLQAAEKAKIELSFNDEALISIPYLHHFDDGTNYHFQKKFSRAQLETMTSELVESTLSLVQKTLEDASLKPGQIERIVLVGGQSRMPLIKQRINAFFGREPYTDLNPEEVVAQGAAIQSEIISGKVRDLLLLDVTPLSLGVETKGDSFTKIIERNTTIPVKKSMIFSTITDNQTTVTIHVLQGERELASGNVSLGKFNLVGIPLAPKGLPQIEVIFEIDANGIVKVSAVDTQTCLSQSMKVNPASGLAPEEIEKLVNQAREFADQDRNILQLNKLRQELRDEAEAVRIYLRRFEGKLTEQDVMEIESLLEKVAESVDKEDRKHLANLLNRLQSVRLRLNTMLISELEPV